MSCEVRRNPNRESELTDAVESRLRVLLKEGPETPAEWKWTEPRLPSYYDEEKFLRGQRMFYDNMFAMMVAKLSGLVALLAVPTVLDIIMFTRQSGTPCTAFRRYVSTILHTFVWYDKTPSKENAFLQSLKIVHKKHCVAFRKSAESGLRRASQLDMALAQFGFVGFTLLCGEQLGVVAGREQLEGLVHFWRVVGSMLGMKDSFNLCDGTVEESRALCRRVLDDVFLPLLTAKNKVFDEMGHVLLEGLWPVVPHLDPRAFVTFTVHLATTAASNNNHSIEIDTSNLSSYGRFILNFQLFVHRYLVSPVYWWSAAFRAFFNGQMKLAIFLTEKFPFLAYWAYGRKRSHVDIFRYHVD